jgi:hypothetical protein
MGLIRRNILAYLQPWKYRDELAGARRLLACAKPSPSADAELLDRLRRLLESDLWEVRNCAVKIIARARCEPLYHVLTTKLVDRNEAVIIRRNCAERLTEAEHTAPEVIDALRRACSDPYWEVRAEALRSLARLADGSPELEAELLRVGEVLLDAGQRAVVREEFECAGSSARVEGGTVDLAPGEVFEVRVGVEAVE